MAREIDDFILENFLDHFNPSRRGVVGARKDLLPPRPLIWKTYGTEQARAEAAARNYFLRAFGCEPEKTRMVKEPMPLPLGVYGVELHAQGRRRAVF
jgi:hypothetical protein